MRTKTIQAWAQLLRLPNLFTVPGDAMIGVLLAGGVAAGWNALAYAGGSVLCLYMAGLLLNDYYDLEEDRRDRPERPLPSHAAHPEHVLIAGVFLLGAGILLAAQHGGEKALIAGTLLAGLIVLYNAALKRHPVWGAINMGCCRGGAVLLGALMIGPVQGVFGAAAFHVFYITIITLMAAEETHRSPTEEALLPGALFLILTGSLFAADHASLWVLILGIAGCVESILAAARLMGDKMPTPAYIGLHIRLLISVQAMWALHALRQESAAILGGIVCTWVLLRIFSGVCSKRFYGS